MERVSGQCYCGAVQFEIELPVNWVGHCHCTMCRRAHGAAYVTWVSVPEARFHLIAGDHLHRFASSDEADRAFCDRCGSTLLFLSRTRWKGEVHVVRANLDDAWEHPDGGHAYLEHRAPWLPDALLPEIKG